MEKTIVINGYKINYIERGYGNNIVLLHGWGCDHTIFNHMVNYLASKFHIIALDLPGFGKSEIPSTIFSVEDYANVIQNFIEKLNLIKPSLIGHSFGGRISIILGAREKAEKIVLIDSAGIKPKKTVKYYLQIYAYKFIKKLSKIKFLKSRLEKLKSHFGSSDYKNSDGIMRQILIKAVNSDQKEYLSQILSPTLLLWGRNDKTTPIQDAYEMKKFIKDSGVVVFENSGHYSFLDKPIDTNIIIENFISGN